MLSFWIGLSFGCIILLACGNIERFRIKPHDPASTSSSKDDTMMADIEPRSEFVNRFSRALQSSQIADGPFPFIIQEGKVLCKKTHREQIRNSQGAMARSRLFVEMIQNGMAYWSRNKNMSTAHSLAAPRLLPILLLNGDGTGCDITKREDGLNYPRLAWSVPSLAYGNGWCNAFGMTSYQAWSYFQVDHPSWKKTFSEQSTKYPWSLKLDKAVWRGSPTAARHYQSRTAKGEWLPRKSGDSIAIPRERLVRKSIEYPELIDASFTKIDGRVLNETRLTERMDFEDQMKYKAIFDIDGNGWSSRFPMLLCTNSVVIKIDPDFIEPFYHNLKPMIHYVPASLNNLTQVVSMVLHKDNDDKMQAIVNAANSWCMMEMTKSGMARDTLQRLEDYGQAIRESVLEGSLNVSDIAEDLEECRIEGRPKKRGKGKEARRNAITTNSLEEDFTVNIIEAAKSAMTSLVHQHRVSPSADGRKVDKKFRGQEGRRSCDVLLESFGGGESVGGGVQDEHNVSRVSRASPFTKKQVSYSLLSCDDHRLGNKLPLIYMMWVLARSAGTSFTWNCLSEDTGTVVHSLQDLHKPSFVDQRFVSSSSWPSLQSICNNNCTSNYPSMCEAPSLDLAADWIRQDLQVVTSTIEPTLPAPVSDVAIHLRCGDIFRIHSPAYGFLPHSTYVRLIQREYGLNDIDGPSSRELNASIGIITQPFASNKSTRKGEIKYGSRCKSIVNDLVKTLETTFPASSVAVFNQPEDKAILKAWTRLAKAQRMTICGPSTFAIWPTLSSNKAYIYGSRLFPWIKEVSQRWKSLETFESPLLNLYTGNDEKSPPPLSAWDMDDILGWLREK